MQKSFTETDTTTQNTDQILPERGRKIALARYDLLKKWEEYRFDKVDKLSADYEFVQLHNTNTNSQGYLKSIILPWIGLLKVLNYNPNSHT